MPWTALIYIAKKTAFSGLVVALMSFFLTVVGPGTSLRDITVLFAILMIVQMAMDAIAVLIGQAEADHDG